MRNPPEATEWWIGAWSDLGKARVGAGLGARRRTSVRALLGSGWGREASACERRAKTRHVRGGVALQGARHGEAAVRAAAERRRAALKARV